MALPRGCPTYDAIDLPQQVRILGAAAAGGYVAAHTQIAALAAVTDETSADAIVNGRRTRISRSSPLTLWGAARIEHQIGRASVVGITGDRRRSARSAAPASSRCSHRAPRSPAASTRSFAPPTASTSSFPWLGGSGVFGSAGGDHDDRGDLDALLPAPRSHLPPPRPDAHSLLGWNGGAYRHKRAGHVAAATFGLSVESPGFELNDLGALHQADGIDASGELSLATSPSRPSRSTRGTSARREQEWTFGGVRKPASICTPTPTSTFTSLSPRRDRVTLRTPGDVRRPHARRSADAGRAGAERHRSTCTSPSGRANQLVVAASSSCTARPLEQGVDVSVTAATRVTPALRLDVVAVA